MNRADSVQLIVLSGEQHLCLGLADFVFESFNQRTQLAQRIIVLFCKLEEHARVCNRRLKLFLPCEDTLQTASSGEQFLRRVLIAPEILRGGLSFNAFKLSAFGSYIKETSRVVRRACASLRKSFVNLKPMLSLSLFNHPSE
jgi:hypothetical protein